jgi:hypothetical protein
MRTFSDSYVSRVLFAPPPFGRVERDYPAVAPPHSLAVRSIPGRAPLHVRPRPKPPRKRLRRLERVTGAEWGAP